jgi:hypothetical protein
MPRRKRSYHKMGYAIFYVRSIRGHVPPRLRYLPWSVRLIFFLISHFCSIGADPRVQYACQSGLAKNNLSW